MKTTSDLIYLLFSIFLHLVLVLVMLFRIFIFPSERPEFIQSVRVDLVALPDKDPETGPVGAPPEAVSTETTKKETPPEKTKEPDKDVFVDKKSDKKPDKKLDKTPKEEEKKKVSEKNEPKEKVKDQQNASLDRLKALAKIKDMKSKQDAAAAEKLAKEGKQYKGNVLSEGTSLTGVDKLQHDQYLGKLDAHIKNNWKLPAWLTNKPYSTAVLVHFDEKGLVLDKKIVRSSGNSAYDAEALQAVSNSVPFPEPPEHLVNYFKVRGIELRFPE
ncbi:MAG: cell envelope integrity protein TolA [Bdellovibrionaceae bacterium]|nr:cell envelope integrity protein TolA [Pseudobdellovibrionaceae bacterium]